MQKLVSVLIAAFIFYVIIYFLVPLLPAPMHSFVLIIVVLIAIIFLIGLITDYRFPWNK